MTSETSSVEDPNPIDLIIVGAGPSGLACGIEAQAVGLSHLIVEKGGITDSIRRFPRNMTFFSTPDLLELGDIPFSSVATRPNRNEVLVYYRRVCEHFKLNIKLHCAVTRIRRVDDQFEVETQKGRQSARNVVIATGYFDNTNLLGVPGENLPHVRAYYDEPYEYAHSRVCVIGGRNSAVETALELFRNAAQVDLVHRGPALGNSVKYWVMPDIQNRIKSGEIRAHFNSVVEEIRPGKVCLRNTQDGTRKALDAEFVIKHIGHRPDEALLRDSGIELDDTSLIPAYDAETFETSVPGLFLAGSVVCGCETWNIFIENGRKHAQPIIARIIANQQ